MQSGLDQVTPGRILDPKYIIKNISQRFKAQIQPFISVIHTMLRRRTSLDILYYFVVYIVIERKTGLDSLYCFINLRHYFLPIRSPKLLRRTYRRDHPFSYSPTHRPSIRTNSSEPRPSKITTPQSVTVSCYKRQRGYIQPYQTISRTTSQILPSIQARSKQTLFATEKYVKLHRSYAYQTSSLYIA